MKYFIERTSYDFGESRFIEVSEKYGDNYSAHEINIIEGCYTFHLYLFPQNGAYLLCVWFNFDSVLNVNHWDDILGVPKLISPNEFLKYKSIMAKPFPNYIHAYERGRKKDFSAPALCRIGDVSQNGAKKWCMCKKSNWSYGANDNLLEECYVLLRYGLEMFKQLNNNNIDTNALLIGVNNSFDFTNCNIKYTLRATSSAISIASHKRTFASVQDKPSNIIRNLLYNDANED